MLKYIGSRILSLIPVLLGISFCSFLLGTIAPGDPVEQVLVSIGIHNPTQAEMEDMRNQLGLNDSIITQYFNWLSNVLKGDFGESYFTNIKVADEFARRIPVTLKVASIAMVLSVVMSIILGICMAMWSNKLIDKILRVVCIILLSIPGFWLAMLLIILFAEKLYWLPTSGNGGIKHMILPAFTLACANIGTIARITRTSLLVQLGEPYILVGKAKGLGNKLVVLKHATINALIPIVTLIGNFFGGILGGATVVESIFALQGMGSYVLTAIKMNDYIVVQAYVLYTGIIYVVVSLSLDILYILINPKMRLGQGVST